MEDQNVNAAVEALTKLRDYVRTKVRSRDAGLHECLRDADRALTPFGVPLEPKRDA